VLDTVANTVRAAGIGGRPLRRALAALTEQPQTLAALVRTCALPRRTVEELLEALGDDLVRDGSTMAIRPDLVDAYRKSFGYDQLSLTEPADPVGGRLAAERDALRWLREVVRAAPPPLPELDHVPATATTVARRALWLDGTFDLAGAHVLCVGDHDLTSLALARLVPGVTVTVVDLDERVLAHIDEQRLGVRCLFADLCAGLPAEAVGGADLVVTDPPYTPEGVRLFLARGLQGLRDREYGRLVLAYGFGDRQPALGVKVQQAIGRLQLAIAAVLPDFNRYRGAQAVGSASDLYVLQPTAGTWRVLEQAERDTPTIYTHGPQSVEGRPLALPASVETQVRPGDASLTVGPGWSAGPGMGVAALLRHGLPPALARRPSVTVALDLTGDPGPWLLRALLATNASSLVAVVPNAHSDLATEQAQATLSGLVSAKYTLRLRRSFPEPRYALVEATAVAEHSVARLVLERAHGKVANSWREGLIRSAQLTTQGSAQLTTKNEARAAIAAVARRPELLDTSPMALPRHQLTQLLEDITRSTEESPSGTVEGGGVVGPPPPSPPG
jgi:predicted methyltransferase